MNGTDWQIGRILGIPIKVHLSWFLVFAFLTWSLASGVFPELLPGLAAWRYWGMGGMAAILLFVSVLLHELGHSYVALRYHIPIGQITLFFFGGMAQMREEPPGPRAEFLIAIAGPLVSFALAGMLFGLLSVSSGFEAVKGLSILGLMLFQINMALGLFNLIPGFPLDGGRVLRAGLWAWTGDFYRATRQASIAGQVFGVTFGILGAGLVLGSMAKVIPGSLAANGSWLLLIGLFLFTIAGGNRRQAAIRATLANVGVKEVMTEQVVALESGISVEEAANRYFLPHGYRGFPVLEDGRPVGMVTAGELQALPQALWPWRRVRDIMQPWSAQLEVPADSTVLSALEQMLKNGHDRLVVVDEGKLVGLVTRSGVARLLHLRGAATAQHVGRG